MHIAYSLKTTFGFSFTKICTDKVFLNKSKLSVFFQLNHHYTFHCQIILGRFRIQPRAFR